jgi:molecular chaperone GrpE
VDKREGTDDQSAQQEESMTTGKLPEDEAEAGAGMAKNRDKEFRELNDRYLRLYAEFDNYRKRVSREKEDLLKYGNESLLYEILPAIDHLELALKHASTETTSGLVQGVEMTLRELYRTLEKFGLTKIEAEGKCFDPSVHHAMVQVEREDLDEKMVAEELRAGYRYRDKVLRPSLVAVSIKPKKETVGAESQPGEAVSEEKGNNTTTEEEC